MKILIIQLAKFGDIIQSLPLYREISRQWPNSEIFFLHSDLFSDLFPVLDIKNHLPLNLDLIAEQKENTFFLKQNSHSAYLINHLREFGFDLIYNLNSNPLAKNLAREIKVPIRGFGDENTYSFQSWILSFIKCRRLNTLNLADIFRIFHLQYHDLLPVKNSNPCSNTDQINQIIFQLGSRNTKRQQSIENYADMAKIFLDNGKNIILTGTISEQSYGKDFLNLLNHHHSIDNRIGKTDFKSLKDTITDADLLITGDTGTMHYAGLWNKATLAVFNGTAYPFETLSYNPQAKVLFPDIHLCPDYPCSETVNCEKSQVCSILDLNKEALFLLNLNSETDCYQTSQDSLGQMLHPVHPKKMDTDLMSALFWRNYTALQFLHSNNNQMVAPQGYLIDHLLSEDFHNRLKRELLIIPQIEPTDLDFNMIRMNFRILAPLLYYSLLNKEDKITFESCLSFFTQVSENKEALSLINY